MDHCLQDLIQYTYEGFQCKLVFVGDTAPITPCQANAKPCIKSRLFVPYFSVDVAEAQIV